MRTNLASRAVRRAIAGRDGIRILDFSNNATPTGEEQGILGKIWDWIKDNTVGRFIGWITGKVLSFGRALIEGAIEWTWGLAADLFIQGLEALWEFDWNQSDAELAERISGAKVRMASIWGAWIARGIVKIGTIVISSKIFLPVPVIAKPALSAYIRSHSLPEAISEVTLDFRQAVTTTIASMVEIGYTKIFGYARLGIKAYGDWLQKAGILLPGGNQILKEWGSEDGPEMSLSQAVENKVEKIKIPWVKAFVESALEGAWEGFTDALVMVADDIDNFLQEENQQNQVLGEARALEVLPDRENPNERLLFYGYQNTVIGDVMSTLNTYQMIHNRDIGYVQEEYQQEMLKNKQLIKRGLTLQWRTRKTPPWTTKIPNTPPFSRAEITIPHAKANVTWASIKTAMGGNDGISIGPWRATGVTDKGERPYIFGASQRDAIENLERAMVLSELKLLSISVSFLVKTKKTRRNPIRFYPAFCHVYQAIPSSGREGKEFADGTRANISRKRLDMWRSEPLENTPIFRQV